MTSNTPPDVLTPSTSTPSEAGICTASRISAAASAIDHAQHPQAELPPRRTTNAIPGARPESCGLSFGIAVVTEDDNPEAESADEVHAEPDRRLFADDIPLRHLATRDIVDRDGETNAIEGRDEAMATIRVISCNVYGRGHAGPESSERITP